MNILCLKRFLEVSSDFLNTPVSEYIESLRVHWIVVTVAVWICLFLQRLTFLKSFQTTVRAHSLDVSPWSLPLFSPFHNACAFLHWWSPEVTSPARRSFAGTKGELERGGLSHVGSIPRVFFLGAPEPEQAWPATLLFSPALSHVTCTRQKCYLSSSAGLAGPFPFAI